MNNIAFYAHAGSANHGCEAIIRSAAASLHEALPNERFGLVSVRKNEDEKYITDGTEKLLDIFQENDPLKDRLTHALLYAGRKITADPDFYPKYRYKALRKDNSPAVAVSIGGDNYCYPSMVEELVSANRMFCKQGTKTVLLGCSIEPEALQNAQGLKEDMERYSLITPRESITFDALLKAGISREKIRKLPDPAFALKTADISIPEWLSDGNTAGLNLSPMLEKYSSEKGVSFRAFKALIRHILDNSDMSVALVPHVVRSSDDDISVLKSLMGEFPGNDRIHLIGDMDACGLKAIISRCRFFVGARTHSTIAAYSSMVPTLVAGYSVKSLGIARDLFGTEENYVLPVQNLEESGQLVSAFEWLRENEESISKILADVIPDTVKRAGEHGKLIAGVYSGNL